MLINKFDTFRDDGTVLMKCYISRIVSDPIWSFYFKKAESPNILGKEVEICFDDRLGKCPSIWIGYPESEGSILIDDEDLIKHIISKVENHKRIETQRMERMDCFINYEQSVRDWKIKNIIND